MAELDARRAEVLGNAARIIQRKIRTHIARKEFIAVRKAAIKLQSYLRGFLLDFVKIYLLTLFFLFCNILSVHANDFLM